jgi:predicted enzyme related to lactoylglutathione lyase
MKNRSFAWYDLMTSDTHAAEKFYGQVIGWNAKAAGVGDGPYTIFSVGAAGVCGLMPISDAMCAQGVKPCWTGYILVDDVDAYAQHVKAAGGNILRAPVDIPGVLRFAVVSDPHGAAFILFKGMSDAPPATLAPDAPGTIGWHELHAGDGASAFAFYAKVFGWTKSQTIDMGPMGVYQTFATGDQAVGGMMTKMPDSPVPFWLYYINVDAIDAAAARVASAGGKVTMGPHQVPTGQWIVTCTDPQGAWFALVAPKR